MRASAIGAVCVGMMCASAQEPNAASDPKVEVVLRADRVRIEIDGDLFTEFIFANNQAEPLRRPYLYPVIGPEGVEMTRAYPVAETDRVEAHDHPHHTSMWFAHGDINGQDFWHGPARLSLEGKVRRADDGLSARYRMLGASGEQIGWYTLALTFGAGDNSRWIDQTSTFEPVEGGRLDFGDTKEGTFAIRTHPALRLEPGGGVEQVTGHAINSEGVEGKAVWGKRAAWVDYWGVVQGQRVGVAIFDHPTNPRFPTWWQARDYGLIAANPFGISAFEGGEPGRGNLTVEPGASLRFTHRFLFHARSTDEAGIETLYDAWVRDQPRKTPKEDQP